MSDMDALVELAARAIRESVIIGPFGPNALETLTSGGSTFLTGGEADEAARAALLAVGLPALLECVEAAEGATNSAHADVVCLLEALEISTHARPYSVHEVIQRDVLPAIAALVARATLAGGDA